MIIHPVFWDLGEVMQQIYVTRVVPQNEDGGCDFSQVADALEIGLCPYLKLTRNNIQTAKHRVRFAEKVARYLKDNGVNDIPVDLSSRLPGNLEQAERELELIDRLNYHYGRQVVKDVSFSYGSVINQAEAYGRLKALDFKELPPRLANYDSNNTGKFFGDRYRLSLGKLIKAEEYLDFIERAKIETEELNEKARSLGLNIGPENMPCIDYAEIAEGSREQEDFEKRLRVGSNYFADLNNPGFIGCNPWGDLRYLIGEHMFLTLDTEHLNFSLSATSDLHNVLEDMILSPFPEHILYPQQFSSVIKDIPQEIRIVHLGGGFDLFYEDEVKEGEVEQIASHFPFIFPYDFYKLSKEGRAVYLESVSPYSMGETEGKREEFIRDSINGLKNRSENPKIVMEFSIGQINSDGVWDHRIYSGDLWREFHELSKANLENLLS